MMDIDLCTSSTMNSCFAKASKRDFGALVFGTIAFPVRIAYNDRWIVELLSKTGVGRQL